MVTRKSLNDDFAFAASQPIPWKLVSFLVLCMQGTLLGCALFLSNAIEVNGAYVAQQQALGFQTAWELTNRQLQLDMQRAKPEKASN